jgi:hypothetical protein
MSLLLAMAAVPGMLGTQEAVRQGQQKERREEHRARRCNLVASCTKSSPRAPEINGRPLVLRDGAVCSVNFSEVTMLQAWCLLMHTRFMSTHVARKSYHKIIDMLAIFSHIPTANTKAL